MTANEQPFGREPRYAAAVRRFPRAEFTIRRLIARNEAFRDMCEELAEAEIALANVAALPLELREARQAEWAELVDTLASEIATALRSSDVRLANMEYLRAPLGRSRR